MENQKKHMDGRLCRPGKKIKDGKTHPLLYLPWMRFERMTYRLEGGCSIQLSYQGLLDNGNTKIFFCNSLFLLYNFLVTNIYCHSEADKL